MITPVTPKGSERLVLDTNPLIIDFTAAPKRVTLDAVIVYDEITGFHVDWVGSLINTATGKRLVAQCNNPLTNDHIYTIVATTATETLQWVFEVRMVSLTSTYNASSPRVVETGAYTWVAYVKEPGDTYLRKADPITAETLVVPADVVDIGYDPDLGKLVLLWVQNGKVFVVTADPSDSPNTLINLLPLNSELKVDPGEGKSGCVSTFPTVRNFPPAKKGIVETLVLGPPGDAGAPKMAVSNQFNWLIRTSTPIVLSVPPEDVVRVLIYRITAAPETNWLIGFNLIKMQNGYPNAITFIPFTSTQQEAVYIDPMYNPGTWYAVVPLYRKGANEIIHGAIGGWAVAPSHSSTLTHTFCGAGHATNVARLIAINNYPPAKKGCIEPLVLDPGTGYANALYIKGYGTIGVG